MKALWNTEKYTLSYKTSKNGEVSFLLEPVDSTKTQAIDYPHRLLYIIKSESEFVYVGEAKAELKTRLQRGFTSYRYYKRTEKARGGYKGYKWIELLEPENAAQKQLDVWVVLFPALFDDKRDFVEAVEGEVVWEIRHQTGKWPTYQNEIHFNNKFGTARDMAIEIVKITNNEN